MASDPEVKGLGPLRRVRTRRNATNLHREQTKTAYTPVYYRQLYKRIAGWAFVSLGMLVAGSHVITHLGYFQVLLSVGIAGPADGVSHGGTSRRRRNRSAQ